MQTALSILPELASGRGTARRVVEGQSRPRFNHNPAKDRIHIAENVGSGNAERPDPCCLKPSVPFVVPLRPITTRMRCSIHFDRQPGIAAVEVQNIRARRMLTPELEALGTLTKRLPEDDLGQSHLSPKAARATRGRRPRLWCNIFQHTPPPCYARSPSPRRARGGFTSSLAAAASTRPRRLPAAPWRGCRGWAAEPDPPSRYRRPRHSP